MPQLPTALISELYTRPVQRPRDGMHVDTLERLVDTLAQKQVNSPAVTSLMRGKMHPEDLNRPVLMVLGTTRVHTVAEWAGALAMASLASVVACSVDDLQKPDHLDPRDAPLLTGHGIVVASRGVTGRPLVGRPLEELRRELVDSRRRLSEWAGYQVRTLCPNPSAFGRAVDGLILEEARRAGYKLVLQPGRAVTDLDHLDEEFTELRYRTVRTDDTAKHLHDWVVGHGLSRPLAQVRQLVHRPRRILSRFGID